MNPLSLLILGLSLLTGADSRALSRRSITWNECAELNQNVSALGAASGSFEPFECGSIPVPLDYTNESSPSLALDLFRVKATKEPVLGTVLFNPGGPGGEAATSLPISAAELRSNIGEQYHLVSWDPRGTGFTIPYNCTLGAQATSQSPSKRDVERLDAVNLTEYFLSADGWDYAGSNAEYCSAANNETASLIGTAFTARDMLAIVDALGEDGMLRYYGVSYGTVLGHYFAVMFPDRIERMVLDGNLDPADYANGTWGDSVRHWDEVFDLFLEACFENKEECSFATYINANSTEDLFNAINLPVEQLVNTLEANTSNVEALTAYAAVKGEIHNALYYPSKWPSLADKIVAVLNATTTDAANSPAANTTETWTYGQAVDAIQGIRSADTIWTVATAEEYLPVAEYQANVSSVADIWYFRAWIAAQWKLPAKERPEGKFEAKTKNPILYVNGDYDPVTPIEAAERASKGFEGSVVLGHGGIGHTVLADPSVCVQKHVQAYFANGTLPENGTHCDPDLKPWQLAQARDGKAFGVLNVTASES